MSTKTTYTVVHTVEGEPSNTMYQVTKGQLTDPAWISQNIFNIPLDWQPYISKSISTAIKVNPDKKMFIFEGDAGYIFIFKTSLTDLYETISL